MAGHFVSRVPVEDKAITPALLLPVGALCVLALALPGSASVADIALLRIAHVLLYRRKDEQTMQAVERFRRWFIRLFQVWARRIYGRVGVQWHRERPL